MAIYDELRARACNNGEWDGESDRARSVGDVERRLWRPGGRETLRGVCVCVMASARSLGFFGDACSACARLDAATASGCDGASMAETCLDGCDGGGVDGGARETPCRRWEPSAMGDSSPPWNHRDCAAERDPCLNFARVNVVRPVCSMDGDPNRGRAAWSGPSLRVAVVTQPWVQQSARGVAPSRDRGSGLE
jgi:hypothetical protein